ncbi:hypothetical protein AVEN_121528-1 [Araneus ventricosus]|uniref:Uncharacterized protein n=1 Tax=Araneus ventricosus TaxID=182803 RepID=A0A4Y2QJR5_ARAVE|nr:hypothetical protein AVEN_121528-1 [Araneus ventricosus]
MNCYQLIKLLIALLFDKPDNSAIATKDCSYISLKLSELQKNPRRNEKRPEVTCDENTEIVMNAHRKSILVKLFYTSLFSGLMCIVLLCYYLQEGEEMYAPKYQVLWGAILICQVISIACFLMMFYNISRKKIKFSSIDYDTRCLHLKLA